MTPKQGYAEALRRIEAARQSDATMLNLSGLKLTAVPKELGELKALTVLYLFNNQLSALPKELGELKALTELYLSSNQLTAVPKELGELKALTILRLDNNQLTALPKELGELKALTGLYLAGNQLTALPKELGELKALTVLFLPYNQLSAVPKELGELKALTELDLSHNELTALPKELGELKALTELFLHDNPALGLPPEVLGPRFDECKSYGGLKEPAKPAEILAYYFGLQKAVAAGQTRRLNEAKLVVVGSEAVGKTSLVRYLIDKQPRNPSERKTPGLSTREKIDIRTFKTSEGDHDAPRLNVWDFGGQEVMYETHQYFLRERCLYLLVLEARREDDPSLHYWMKTIRNRGGDDAPVIVVINKYEPPDQVDKVDDTAERRRYPNIRAIVRTSCNPGNDEKIESLRELIRTLVHNDPELKHVHDPLKASHAKVKESLGNAARSSDIVDATYYEQLCRDAGIHETDEQRRLLDLLDAIGVVVAHHGPGAPEGFYHCTLLNPNWVTQAIYGLLLDERIGKQNAEVDIEHLGDHLREPQKYPRKYWGLILEMMEHFNLCFPVKSVAGVTVGRRYLIPAQLSKDEPETLGEAFPEKGTLRFEYRYDLVPPWLVPRLIVEAREHLGHPRIAWRNGVVIRVDGCEVLVRAESSEKRVRLFVRGEARQRRSALSVVRGFMETVHAMNRGISPESLIPLPDSPDAEPVAYAYVCELERDDGPEYSWRPPGAKRKYTVRELLDCVETQEERPSPRRGGEFSEGRAGRPEPDEGQRISEPRPIVALRWEALDANAFERLLYNIVGDAANYENATWLMRTNAPDRGRDVSVYRTIPDEVAEVRRERVVVQCKHWQKDSVDPLEIAKLILQMNTWTPPEVDVLAIATSGDFTADAVLLIEQRNHKHERPRIEMWNKAHLEKILARRPALVREFKLGKG